MIKNYKKLLIFMSVSIGLIATACETTEETFEEMAAIIAPGNMSARFSIVINADPKVTKGFIKWVAEDELKIHEFEVIRTRRGIDTLIVEVNDIQEGNRTFSISLSDQQDRESLPFEVTSLIYGPIYRSNLVSRTIEHIEVFLDSSAVITWSTAPNGAMKTTFSYTDKKGLVKKLDVPNDTTTTELPGGIDPNITYTIVSTYKPEEDALDLFDAELRGTFPKTADLNLSYVGLVGDPAFGGGDFTLAAALDGDPGTPGVWSTAHPAIFTVDLGGAYKVVEIELDGFKCCGGAFPIVPKVFQVWGIADLTGATPTLAPADGLTQWEQESIALGWTKLAEVNRPDVDHTGYTQKIDNDVKVRYVRLLTTDTFRSAQGGNQDTGSNGYFLRTRIGE